MDDDFNTPAAIAILFEMTREINNLKKDEEIEKANNLGSELKMLSQSLGILQKIPQIILNQELTLQIRRLRI